MRITEHRMMRMISGSLSRARTDISKASQELSSGVRVSRPSDDLAAWSEGTRAQARKQLSEAHRSAFSLSRELLTETERQLETMGDQVQTGLALALQYANGSYNATDRAQGAEDIRILRDRFLAAINGKGHNGEYLFGGSDRTQAPFEANGVYSSDDIARDLPLEGDRLNAVTITGYRFTSAGGFDIYGALDQLATALDANDQAGIMSAVDDIRRSTELVASTRAEVGIRMTALDDANEARQALELQLTEIRANRQGADAFQAAIDLTQGQNVLEGARVVIQRLSTLFSAA